MQRARDIADAYLEVEELVAQTRLQAQQATPASTLLVELVSQASVGAMNEQKLANKLSRSPSISSPRSRAIPATP